MSNALSMDLRVRFKRLMDGGMKAAAAGRVLLLSRATAARWGKKVRNGEPLEPRPSGPRIGSGKLEPCMPFFAELIEQDPDITLAELRAALWDARKVQYRSHNDYYGDDGIEWRWSWLCGFAHRIGTHFAFDASWIASISPQRETLLQHFVDDTLVESFLPVRGGWRLLQAVGDGSHARHEGTIIDPGPRQP